MCFSIPLKVIDVKNHQVTVEGNKKIIIGKDTLVKKGEYLQVVGNLAVGRLTKIEGQRVRKLIKSLN
jgi:hydrogenase maturation factor